MARRLDFVGRARPTHVLSPRRHSPEAEGSLGGSSSSSMQRASSRRWPTAEGVRGAVRGRGARQAGAARCASQYAGCAAGAPCADVGLAQAGPASAAAACVARRGGLTIRFTVHCFLRQHVLVHPRFKAPHVPLVAPAHAAARLPATGARLARYQDPPSKHGWRPKGEGVWRTTKITS